MIDKIINSCLAGFMVHILGSIFLLIWGFMGDRTREKLKRIPIIGKINFPKYTRPRQAGIAIGILFVIDIIVGILWYLLSWILPVIMVAVLLGALYFDEIVEFFKGKTISRNPQDMAVIEHHVINGVMNTAPFWTTVSTPRNPDLIRRNTDQKNGLLYVHVWIPKKQNIHLCPSDLEDIIVLLQTQLDDLSMAGGAQFPRFFVQSAFNAGGMVDIEILTLDCPQAVACRNQTLAQRQQSLMPKEDDIDDVEF